MTQPTESARSPIRRCWGLVPVAAVLALAYWPTFLWMWDRWWAADSYYSHGILVPLVSAYLVWRQRECLARLTPAPSAWGGVLLGVGLLALVASMGARIDSAGAFTLLPVLAGLVLLLAGPRVLRVCAFPIAFLFFMIPLPMQLIAQLNLDLKVMATRAAEALLTRVFGVAVLTEGSKMFFGGDNVLVVEDVCSGLRSLVALVAFAALYAYISKLTWPRKLVMLATAGPLAVTANIIRITGLGVVAHRFGAPAASGWVHDVSGYLVFVVALALMFLLESLLLLIPRRGGDDAASPEPGEPAPAEPDPASDPRGALAISNRRALATAVCMMPAALLAAWLSQASPAPAGGDYARRAVPTVLSTPSGPRWVSLGESTFSARAMAILETDDYLSRTYVNQSTGERVELVIVFSKDNRKGTHPPEVCLKGDGASVQGKQTVRVPVPELPGGAVAMNRLRVDHNNRAKCYLYTYKCGDRFTPSFNTQQLILLWNGIWRRPAGGALIRLSTAAGQNGDQAAYQRLVRFARLAMPHIAAKLHARPTAHSANQVDRAAASR